MVNRQIIVHKTQYKDDATRNLAKTGIIAGALEEWLDPAQHEAPVVLVMPVQTWLHYNESMHC